MSDDEKISIENLIKVGRAAAIALWAVVVSVVTGTVFVLNYTHSVDSRIAGVEDRVSSHTDAIRSHSDTLTNHDRELTRLLTLSGLGKQ